MSKYIFIPLVAAVCLLSACSRPKPIAVGSKDSTEQRLLAEITAQHLEHRFPQTEIRRRFNLGDTRTIHQALLNSEIGLYPEYSGLVVTELLKEIPSNEASVVMERARMELKRISLLDFVVPFGFEARDTIVVKAADAEKMNTATEAAAGSMRWKVGLSYDFQNKDTGLPSFNMYRMPMGAPLRSMKAEELFNALADGTVSMILTSASDGHLLNPAYKPLVDDQKAFPPMESGLIVRDDVLAAEPKLRAALNELSMKISLDQMRKMNAQVDIDKGRVEDVARDFLKSAGLD